MSTADTINTWFQERLACGPIARDTEAYNQASAALPDLISRLEPAQQAERLDPPAPDAAPRKGAKITPADPPAPDGPATTE